MRASWDVFSCTLSLSLSKKKFVVVVVVESLLSDLCLATKAVGEQSRLQMGLMLPS